MAQTTEAKELTLTTVLIGSCVLFLSSFCTVFVGINENNEIKL